MGVESSGRACSGAGFSLLGRKVLDRAVTEQLSSAQGRLPDLGPCFHVLKLRCLSVGMYGMEGWLFNTMPDWNVISTRHHSLHR